ncbi:MAG: response regulator [Oligoflexia bacterium]|nr:response regulator [Oligoflexia bacterium]
MSVDFLGLNTDSRYRVLIVDASPEVCQGIKNSLSSEVLKFRIELYSAFSIPEANIVMEQIEPDCIICDMGITQEGSFGNGIEFLSSLTSDLTNNVRILLSEHYDFENLKNAINEAGIYRFVLKPWSDDELRSAVENSLEYLDLHRENSRLVSKAEAKTRYLLRLKSILETKDREKEETIKVSGQLVKGVKMEVEVMNKLLTVIQRMKSVMDIERMLREILEESMGVNFVKIVLDGEVNESSDETPFFVSVPLLCSGYVLGHIRVGKENEPVNEWEKEFLQKIADVVAMTAEKLIRFSVLERLKKQWESTFDSIDDPLIIIDRNFVISRANRSFERLTGVRIQEIIGMKCYELFQGDGPVSSCDGCNVMQAFDAGIPVGSEILCRKNSRYYTTWSYPIFEDNTVNNVVQFYKDISEQKMFREKILHSEKLAEIGILAGSVAHEINNPIGGIIAFLQIMSREVGGDCQVYSDLKEMENAAQRCKHIVENLLHFSRKSRDEELRDMEISNVINSLLPLIELQIRHDNIEIIFNDQSEGGKIRGVFNELVQAFLNIVYTSVEAITNRNVTHGKKQERGVISINAFLREGRLVVELKDNGVPLDLVNVKLLDGKEFRSLGMFVTTRIVKDYGGSIDILNYDNSGNCFVVTLPLAG